MTYYVFLHTSTMGKFNGGGSFEAANVNFYGLCGWNKKKLAHKAILLQ